MRGCCQTCLAALDFRARPVWRQLDLGPTRPAGGDLAGVAQAREIAVTVPSALAGGRRISLACIDPSPEAARRDAGPAPEGANEVGGIGVAQLESDIRRPAAASDHLDRHLQPRLLQQRGEAVAFLGEVALQAAAREAGAPRDLVCPGASLGEKRAH